MGGVLSRRVETGTQLVYGSLYFDDIMSRLATIGDGTITQASYKYLGAGRIVAEDYAESQVKLDYTANNLAPLDRFGRVTDQVWADYGTTPETSDEYTYSYDRAGNRTSRANELRTALSETYQYNGLDALVSSVRNDSFDQSWTLDGLGNWSSFNDDGSSQARTANAANEIGSITGGWATPVYDPAGNMTTIPAPLTGDADHALGAKYDAWNHLVETSDGGVLVARFVYDGAGRRIEQLSNYVGGVPQQATHYYLSGQNQVLETREGLPASSPESLSPKYQNVWSPRYIDALVLRDSYSGGVLQPASRLYYLSDANYNVTALVGKVNDTWQTVERYAYTAYGKAAIYTPDWSSTRTSSLYGNATLYTGRELDASTNLYYYRARYYSADLGSFVGRDPIAFLAGDENLYRYVDNSPLIHIDPSGNECKLVQPPVMIYRAPSFATAIAGGIAYDFKTHSTSPAPIRATPVEWIRCRAERMVDVKYTCTETYSVYSGICLWWENKTVTYSTYKRFPQTLEWDLYLKEVRKVMVSGPQVKVGIPGVSKFLPRVGPGVQIGWYKIEDSDMPYANNYCKEAAPSAPWDAYKPDQIIE